MLGDDIEANVVENPTLRAGDPLVQGDGHDHSNASQHEFGTDNMELLDFNPLTTTGNAEVQVATTPDGDTYAYLAGWNDMHIVDVTDPNNTTLPACTTTRTPKSSMSSTSSTTVAVHHSAKPTRRRNADPNVGEWSDPAQVTVTLIDYGQNQPDVG